MAVTEIHQSRRISNTINRVEQERLYIVDGGDPEAVITDKGVPQLGDRHPTNPTLYVTEQHVEPVAESSQHVRLIIVYSREGYEKGKIEEEETELDMCGEETRVFWDLNGKLIRNDATGEDGTDVFKTRIVLVKTKYQRFLNEGLLEEMVNTVNKHTWRGKPAGTWFFEGVEARKIGHEKWQVVYRFIYDPDGHQLKSYVIHWTTVTDPKTGEEATEPRIEVKDGKYSYVEQPIYKETNFGLLNLG